MKKLCNVVVNGERGSAYNSSIWILSVFFDGLDVFTVDGFGDSDTIGQAEDEQGARSLCDNYFSAPYYEKLS